jgi:uncharacterized protein
MTSPLPHFPYHRDPVASGSVEESDATCDCCGQSRGTIYSGVTYCRDEPTLCPWCIADGSAANKYDATFFDGVFVDDDGNRIDLPEKFDHEVFGRTIGFATFNPIGWWVHCGQPAEYITRNEPYEMVFECRRCHKRHVVNDFD